jgi:outer membrane protein assembly factor BamB
VRTPRAAAVLATLLVALLAASAAAAADWTRFGYDRAKSNRAPHGLSASQVRKLSARRAALPGTVDASPIYASRVRVKGKRRNLLIVETSYGRVLGLTASTGATLWRFTPSSYGHVRGSAQITQTTPVLDSSRHYVFAATPDGRVRKINIANGHQVTKGRWPVSVTRDATHEKTGASLNLDGRNVLVTTGGYSGDAPPYQGKVVSIDRKSGRIRHVFNSLCSNRRRIIVPSSCGSQESAIWGRAGAPVDPRTHRVYVASSNGPFNGSTDWADSVLEFSPGVGRLLRHYTPGNQKQLEDSDRDLGSTAPALLRPAGSKRVRYLIQGGKDGKLRLLSLSKSLHSARRAGGRLGGQVQTLDMPGSDLMFTAPAVLHTRSRTLVFVANSGATAAYGLSRGRLHQLWRNDNGGTSPVIAGSLLYVYDPGGGLNVYRPGSGKLVRSFDLPGGHWNSPIVAGGRVYVPTGDANDHSTSGDLFILHR